MKMLTGLLMASKGEAWLFSQAVNPKDIESRRRVGYMTQSFSLYSELTVAQNLTLHARLFSVPAGEISDRAHLKRGIMKIRNTVPGSPQTLQNALVLTMLIVLIAIFSPPFSKAGSSGEMADSSRSQQLATRAPRTPEELLRLIKEWTENPQMDGYEFGERILGVGRDKWGPVSPYTSPPLTEYNPWISFKENGYSSPAGYAASMLVFTEACHLWNVLISLNDIRDKGFCVTPELVQQIFGKPKQLFGMFADLNGDPLKYPILYYKYNVHMQYNLEFTFPIIEKGKDWRKFSNEERRRIKSLVKDFDYHKSFCSNGFDFGTRGASK